MLEKFRHCFKKIFSSVSDLKQVKKTPDFYDFICNDLEIAPSRLIHVGENWESDFVFPRKAGVQSFLLDRRRETPATYVLKDLRELLEILK
jgi:FMN phosphatase YigB (HAD superfamily)